MICFFGFGLFFLKKKEFDAENEEMNCARKGFQKFRVFFAQLYTEYRIVSTLYMYIALQ